MDAESGGLDGAKAALWLKDAGLSYLISNKGGASNENSGSASMVMFGSLTRRQSIAVQKRLREVGTPASSADQTEHGRPNKLEMAPESPLVGRLVSSFSGPLDSPKPQKTCVSVSMGSSLLNASKRSGSYDLGKLNITDTSGVVLKSRKQVDIIEPYETCHPPEAPCVYREGGKEGTRASPTDISSLYEGFPQFSLTSCDVGVTLACHDLSAEDLIVVRRLAFIESSAVFDELNIRKSSLNQTNSSSTNSLMSLLSGKSSKNLPTASASALQFSSLETIISKSRSQLGRQARVPMLIARLIAELCSPRCSNAEGLFRIPPSQQRLRMLLQNIQSSDFNELEFDFSEVPASDLAALLKHIIRALSPSLLTSTLERLFVLAISDIPNESSSVTPAPQSSIVRERLRLINLIVLQLPDVNRDTLQLILSGLRTLAGPSSNNRMTASSLAVVLAPLFFPSLSHLTDAEHLHRQVFILQLLIIYADVLFVVPNQLLDQVRLHTTLLNQRNFVSAPKHTRKVALSWWRFWSRERVAARKLLTPTVSSPVVSDQPVLSISAPNLFTLLSNKGDKRVAGSGGANSEIGTTVQLRLKAEMKVSDAVEVTVKNILTVSPSIKTAEVPGHEWFLFEIGGNIHERCLDPCSILISVYRRNPAASWELRLLCDNRVPLPDPLRTIHADKASSEASR